MVPRGADEPPPSRRAAPALVLGTAGHIDHGKTTLVRRLTGVDTDRLPEEKARGISLELGFAPLTLEGGLEGGLDDGRRLGVVDVPGHERLVRTMVAGASGIDLVLLVVAADEGVMPQTREHLAVCRVLGLDRGVVALTRCDLADDEVAALAEEEVRQLLTGSPLAGAPIVRCSAATGAGLGALRRALGAAARAASPRTAREGPPRLWVDRAFQARGFGTVVTGTLTGSALAVGDALSLLPAGRPARVRGLQQFGAAAERIGPGARCAVNLGGVHLDETARGMRLTAPEALAVTRRADVWLEWLPGAPALEAEPAPALLLVGTAERAVRVAPIGAPRLEPGAAGLARLHVEGAPLPLLPGDRFVLRGFARLPGGGATLGGGRVLDALPPRRRRSDPALAAELRRLVEAEAEEELVLRVSRCGYSGASLDQLARETGRTRGALRAALSGPCASAALVEIAGGVLLAGEACAALETRLEEALAAHHARDPLSPGPGKAELAAALPPNAPAGALEALLARLAARRRIVLAEDRVRRCGFAPAPSARQDALAQSLRDAAARAGLEPPTLREWAERMGCAEAELRPVLAHLERQGALVRAPGTELWFDRGAVEALRARVVARLEAEAALPTPAYKALIGTSRKWAVPLMELFDAEKLTLRRGEVRVLRRSPRRR